jgi:hypothetical protein
MTNPHLELEPYEMDIVRRSTRDPAKAHLEKSDVKTLLQKIRQNHSDTVILKLKDHLMSDINSVVLDEIILTLYSNKVCQALYFQNLSKAMNDEQLGALTALLKKKKIWCMNLGENYNVSITGWTTFCHIRHSSLCFRACYFNGLEKQISGQHSWESKETYEALFLIEYSSDRAMHEHVVVSTLQTYWCVLSTTSKRFNHPSILGILSMRSVTNLLLTLQGKKESEKKEKKKKKKIRCERKEKAWKKRKQSVDVLNVL